MIDNRIPKIIHYCWFGRGKKPDDTQYYINTWKKYLPDYQIIEWNEDNFAIEDSIDYVKEAYYSKKWAFVSDYVRLFALQQYGGIYFDTDVEVFKSFDSLLENKAFFGFESKDYLTTAVMAAEKGSSVIQQFMDEYKNRHFIKSDGTPDIETTNVVVLTRLMTRLGLQLNGKQQNISGILTYPQAYFSANSFINIFGKYRKNSYAYHHYNASWYEHAGKSGFVRRCRHYLLGIARNTVGTSTLYRMRHRR